MAVLAIDLDHFKRINDTYHHKAGDQFLIWVADLLQTIIQDKGIAVRVGGDEFILVLDKIQSIKSAITVGYQLYETFETTLDARYRELEIGLSVGASFYPLDSDDPYQLIDLADEAMYKVKRTGKGSFQWEDSLKNKTGL